MNSDRNITRSAWPRLATVGLALGLLLRAARAPAATFTETFSTDPIGTGWQIYGNPGQFTWDRTKQNLRVTWDSSQTNSFFHRPLGTILASDDDFQFGFDLNLEDYAIGTTPGKSSTFEIAIGLLNFTDATQTNFFRGAGINATYGPKNLIEFNFFPAFDFFLPTIGQVLVSTNNAWRYNDSNLLDLTPGETFQVHLSYAAATRTLTTLISNNAAPYGQTQTIVVPANFDFRVSSLAISSYSDAIQPPPAGSILAHGIVDNFHVTVPPPPVENLGGGFAGANWQLHFISRPHWVYALMRTTNFSTWDAPGDAIPGNGGALTLIDSNPPAAGAFYRVKANRL